MSSKVTTIEEKSKDTVLVSTELELNFKTEEFEGPLGLLLYLIMKNKLDITRISLARIVDQFLEYSSKTKMELSVTSEFIRIASILLYLKAKALDQSNTETDEEFEEETEELVKSLETYKQFIILRNKLKKLHENKKYLTKILKKNIKASKLHTVDDILRYAVKYFISIKRDKMFSLKRDEVSVLEKINHIKEVLKIKNKIKFSELIFSVTDNINIIAYFMAILETTKSSLTKIFQESNFSEIFITRRNGS